MKRAAAPVHRRAARALPGAAATRGRLQRPEFLHAPYLLEHELVGVALKKQRLGWRAEAVALALANHAEMDITLHRTDAEAQHALAVLYKLSAYDAAYLWFAAELKAPLATFDKKLAQAANAHLSSLS